MMLLLSLCFFVMYVSFALISRFSGFPGFGCVSILQISIRAKYGSCGTTPRATLMNAIAERFGGNASRSTIHSPKTKSDEPLLCQPHVRFCNCRDG